MKKSSWDALVKGWDAHELRAVQGRQAATIFFDAIQRNDWTTTLRLIERGASPNGLLDGYSPLHLAAKHGALDTAKLLLQSGAPLGAVDPQARDALWHAILNRQDTMMNLLIAKGSDVDRKATSEQRTPLIQAAIDGNYNAAKALIMANAEVNARDLRGQNALHHCLRKSEPTGDDVAIARLLLENGGEPTAVDLKGQRPIDAITDPAYGAALEAHEIAVVIQAPSADTAPNSTPQQKPKNISAPRRRPPRL